MISIKDYLDIDVVTDAGDQVGEVVLVTVMVSLGHGLDLPVPLTVHVHRVQHDLLATRGHVMRFVPANHHAAFFVRRLLADGGRGRHFGTADVHRFRRGAVPHVVVGGGHDLNRLGFA